jgi:hypothetical protein
MSHFTVLVVTDNNATNEDEHYANVEEALQPFREYDTEIDEYVIWENETPEYIEEFKNAETTVPYIFHNGEKFCSKYDEKITHFFIKDDPNDRWSNTTFTLPEGYELRDLQVKEVYDSVEEYCRDWHGYEDENFQDAQIGRMTNPNSKWDWWQIGGRWEGMLLTKSGEKVDHAVKSDVDYETRMKQASHAAGIDYDEMQMIINGRVISSWVKCREELHPGNIDAARDTYNAQPAVVDLKAHDIWIEADDYATMSREEFCKSRADMSVSTFAVLMDGEWNERGNMGWFGCVSGESDTWKTDFTALLNAIPEDKVVTVVDCHI